MIMLRVLPMALAGLFAGQALLASELDVFQTEVERRRAGQMLIEYQQTQILAALSRRDVAVAALTSKRDVQARAAAARRSFIESIGGLPKEKCPLESRTVGVIRRDGYRIEKVLYQSRPNFWIAANLYVPDGLGERKAPAVLTPMGHSSAGKAARWLQERPISLARIGYIALAYDQIGLGERWQYWDPATGLDRIGNRTLSGEVDPKSMRTTDAHSYAGDQAWLTGGSLSQHVVWDAIRGVDYLLTRPEVDAERIACSGASMGGLATMVLTAVEPRLKVSVPVSHVTKRSELVKIAMARDAEQVFLRCYCDGWEHSDLLLPILLGNGHLQIIGNRKDFFPIQGTRRGGGTGTTVRNLWEAESIPVRRDIARSRMESRSLRSAVRLLERSIRAAGPGGNAHGDAGGYVGRSEPVVHARRPGHRSDTSQ